MPLKWRLGVIRSHCKWHHLTDHIWLAISLQLLSTSLSCTNFEIFDAEEYRDFESTVTHAANSARSVHRWNLHTLRYLFVCVSLYSLLQNERRKNAMQCTAVHHSRSRSSSLVPTKSPYTTDNNLLVENLFFFWPVLVALISLKALAMAFIYYFILYHTMVWYSRV